MDSSIVLYKKRIDLGGCMMGIAVFVVPVLAAFFTESLVLSLLATSMCIIVSMRWIDQSNPPEKPVLLEVTEEGMAHDSRPMVLWDEISDIQIVDKVLSVSCDQVPEKDFRLNLNGTDIGSHPSDSLENIIRQYHHKSLYVYQAPPPSCGCGLG